MATDLTSTAPVRPGAPGRRGSRRSRRSRRSRWFGPLPLVAVLAVALLAGSGVLSSRAPGDAVRAARLEAVVRCPSCQDLSVAQSSAPTAIAVRHEIARMVAGGSSDQRIEQALVAQYGEAILLRPPASGVGALVYVVPAVAGGAAVLALGALFWRRTAEMRRLRDKP